MSNNQTPDITGLVEKLEACETAIIHGETQYSDKVVGLLSSAAEALQTAHATGYEQGLRDAAGICAEEAGDVVDEGKIYVLSIARKRILAFIPDASDA